MWCKDEITLASVATRRTKTGHAEHEVRLTEVFAEIKSAKRGEFYDAMRAGIELNGTFKVRSADYSGQKYIRADGVWHSLIRAYKMEDWTELNCREVKAPEKWMEECDDDKRNPDECPE